MFEPRRPEQLSAAARAQLDEKATSNWDYFYRRHHSKFFRDRHYLEKEFPAVLTASSILEVGCGVGNAIYPMLAASSHGAVIYACDCSETAIGIVKQHPDFDAQRVVPFVADIVKDDMVACGVPLHSVQCATVIFCLSAIAPAAMPQAIRNIAGTLVPGSGRLYVRDYAAGDLAQSRQHQVGKARRLESAAAYCRSDGTRTYFFAEEELKQLFAAEGFRCDNMRTEERMIANRARQLNMDRRWVQAIFTYVGQSELANQSGVPFTPLPAPATALGTAAAETSSAAARTDQAVVEHEWSGGVSDGVMGSELSDLFHEPVVMEDSTVELQPGLTLRISAVARQHCHTQSHTGLLVWQAALPLAQLLLRCPQLLQMRSVLELGCGAAGLAAVAAARHCRRFVATDGSMEALRQLSRNLSANAAAFMAERVVLRELAWDSTPHLAGLQEEFPGGFDIVCGADVVYAAAGVPSLFAAVMALMSPSPTSLLLLCHTARTVSEEQLLAHGASSGLELLQWPPELGAAAATLGITPQSTMRLLVFRRTTRDPQRDLIP